ncbi:hypothetical protein EV122DRAFT_185145, partial [Schizophyllum commune]
ACTLVCSKDGMMINGLKANPELLHVWLERIPNRRWADTPILSLLQPDDAQDVPRAVKLLLLISDIRTISTDGMDPHELKEHAALCILGEMFEALSLPFTQPALTISEQERFLIKFAHILAALYKKNGRSFCSNQLYNDFQCMVKAAIYLVAKTLLLNPKLGCYLCLLGDDVLEALFGLMRMMGGHVPNASLLEMKHRAEAAVNLEAIFERHPHLERKGRRLQIPPVPGSGIRARDMDHIRPPTWRGEVSAESCDLSRCWKEGVRDAEAALSKYKVRMDMSFTELFAQPNTDLMRPFGGKYPAISAETDRSALVEEGDSTTTDVAADTAVPTSLRDGGTASHGEIDFEAVVAREKAEIVAHAADAHSAFAIINADGTLGHKKSITSVYFNMGSERMCCERVQRLRDLFATFVSPNGKDIALAVVKPLVIKPVDVAKPNQPNIPSAPLSEIQLIPSRYVVSGQVLALHPLDDNGSRWAWTGHYVRFSTTSTNGGKKRKAVVEAAPTQSRDITIVVPGSLVRPIEYRCVEVEKLPDVGLVLDHDATWVIDGAQLKSAWTDLWRVAGKEPSVQAGIPVFSEAHGAYPYIVRPKQVEIRGVIWAASASDHGVVLKSKQQPCTACEKQDIKDTDRQQHTGVHILKALLRVDETGKTKPISSTYPCGFCGQASVGANSCGISIKSGSAHSSCPRTYAFKLHAARKFDVKRPCTNVPVVCTLPYCGETHWKYNFRQHFTERHPTWLSQLPLDSELANAIRIGGEEQAVMGIPKNQILVWPPLP